MDSATLVSATREWVVFENGGQKIFGVLHLPFLETSASIPAVVFLHGFASHKVGTNRAYVHFADSLVRRGIAALRFDFRGSGDSEGDLSEMTIENLVSDALLALDYTGKHSLIDSSRIGIMGSSLGGSIGILSAARHNQIKALVLWAPVATGMLWAQDWIERNGSAGAPEALTTYRGVKLNPIFREQFGKMQADVTLKQLDQIPLLHIHGEHDTMISIRHQHAFKKQRAGARAETRFCTLPEKEHALGLTSAFPEVMKEAVDWFSRYL